MEEQTCITCRYFAAFEGVCCNGSSEWRGGCPPDPETQGCPEWKEIPYDAEKG